MNTLNKDKRYINRKLSPDFVGRVDSPLRRKLKEASPTVSLKCFKIEAPGENTKRDPAVELNLFKGGDNQKVPVKPFSAKHPENDGYDSTPKFPYL